KVTLDLSDVNLSGALTLLGDIARQDGYTLSVDPRVQGKITLKMTNVPWDQILDFLAENYHLSKVVKDKMIVIAPGN
ncbi:MAG TPA: secretin and TonB N-terminal domain-containing protein, partial [Thermodesulfovibrionales bacterium]|nr:secretin and TonB N-terminal domain-containing protein [Thermodesulfovibrionales bacterium]